MAYCRIRWLEVQREQGSECNFSSVKGRLALYELFVYDQAREELESNGCQIKIECEVSSISKSNGGKSIDPYIKILFSRTMFSHGLEFLETLTNNKFLYEMFSLSDNSLK